MTRESYIRMTEKTRRVCAHLPGGAAFLRVPTYLCALVYLLALGQLALAGDARFLRALLVPAVCFGVVTVLRPLIGKQRPVGSYRPGKGKSMPSRHTASAAAIAFAVIYAFPGWPIAAAMLALSALIASLRVLSGQHDVSDVLAALALSGVISAIGYLL